MTSRKYQNGLSLVELMIAIALGLFLMAGLVQMFIGSKVTFTAQQGLSRVQENGRLAIEFISSDVRMAGFMGFNARATTTSIGSPSITNMIPSPNVTNNYTRGIEVVSPAAPINAVAGTQVLALRGVIANSTASLVSPLTPGSITVPLVQQVNNGCGGGVARLNGLCVNDVAVLSDAERSIIFTPTAINIAGGNIIVNYAGGWGNKLADLHNFYDRGAHLSAGTNTIYFIALNATTGRRGLFQQLNNQPAQEILEGVENMAFSFSRASAPTTFVSALNQIGNQWASNDPPVALRVELLVASVEDNVTDAPQTYRFNGAPPVVAADRRLYQTFSTTIALRNRLP
ncbi:MAG TPA: PilW family protein [Cellvibrio sp.]|nr:PilW family protein [Cellvibrio sp.]